MMRGPFEIGVTRIEAEQTMIELSLADSTGHVSVSRFITPRYAFEVALKLVRAGSDVLTANAVEGLLFGGAA